MGVNSAGQRSRIVDLSKKPVRRNPERFPWPRFAEDDPKIPLGVDVKAKRNDIVKLVHSGFRVPDVPMEELLQEVFLAIVHKNYTRSAHDPRKSSFGHYVWMVANNVCINLVHRKRRYDKERPSLDAPCSWDDSRTLLETAEAPAPEEDDWFNGKVEDIETEMRQQGMWDTARYIRAVRSGASPDVVREALTWENHPVSTKSIRDMRNQVKDFVQSLRPHTARLATR